MTEITTLNFREYYQNIVTDMRNADFISFDCEFTGLGSHSDNISFFDEPEERYESMRVSIANLLVTQLGISIFKHDRNENYKVSTYVFYLYPRTFPYSPESFTCDSRSVQFLAAQNYDFNKTIKYGLTFVTLAQEREVQREIRSGSMMLRLKNELCMDDNRMIQDILTNVYEWLYRSRASGYKIVDLSRFDPIRRFLIRDYIETQFRVRTSYIADFRLKVEKGTRSVVEKRDELTHIVLGITTLIKDMVKLKKPIVGHNMLMDLMMFFKTFIRPLPSEYPRFKREIMKVFPTIYDTKYMSFEMKKKVGKSYLDTSFNLQRLFDYFTLYQSEQLMPDMPTVENTIQSILTPPAGHNSGYDSYCTGYVFLQLAHMFSLWDNERNALSTFSVGNDPNTYLGIVQPMKNRVNMMRGRIGHFNLGGEETSHSMPNLLLVESKSDEPIDPFDLMKTIAKYDNADLRPMCPTQFLVASSSLPRLRAIEDAFAQTGLYNLYWRWPAPKSKKPKYLMMAISAISFATMVWLTYGKKFG